MAKNNPGLFNAALAGAFDGINTSRALRSAVQADYASQKNSALAFANLLDAQIAAGSYSQNDAALLQGLVQQVVTGKSEAAPNITSARAINAAFQAARTASVPEPISPGVWHVDSFGAVSRNFYDATPATEAERTANVIAINAALEFMRVLKGGGQAPGPGGTLLMGPGVYYTNDAVGYDIAVDCNVGVTLQGLGPFPTMLSSNNLTREVFKIYTTVGNIRMFYMKDIAFYGGRTGLSLINADYNRFDRLFFWAGTAQFSLQEYLSYNNVYSECYFNENNAASSAFLYSSGTIFANCIFGESCGAIFVYNGTLQVNGGSGYGMFYNNSPGFYTDYWTTPGSPTNVSLAFWLNDPAAFLVSAGAVLFSNFRLGTVKKFISLSGARQLVMSGCSLDGGDSNVALFQGFIDMKQSFGQTLINIGASIFHWNGGASGFFINEPFGVLNNASIVCQFDKEATGTITDPNPIPGGKNNYVSIRQIDRP